MTNPHPTNFCAGGKYLDWLEVNLTPNCNGKCSWCVDKNAFHPKGKVTEDVLISTALLSHKKNILLLGGEPTLYPSLKTMISELRRRDRNVYLTTNGSLLTRDFVKENLKGLTGINISMHHAGLVSNKRITGVYIEFNNILSACDELKQQDCKVRFNCNLIKNYVDSKERIYEYIQYVKYTYKADSIRFVELKYDSTNFVGLDTIMGTSFGLNDDPYSKGCVHETIIDEIPISFRQMCGLQNPLRPLPIAPKQSQKEVLYYDGYIYNGWQISVEERKKMDEKLLTLLLEKVSSGELSVEEAKKAFEIHLNSVLKARGSSTDSATGFGCVY